jgi:deazaflavin-dependent oxidoreductase (nitroreductase family)
MASLAEKAFGQFLRIHDTVYQRTNGWIGHRMLPLLPSLLLHTVGAKTGKARTTSLTYARDGGDYLVVASNGGSPRSPGWYHNLRASPDIEINVGPKRFGVTARPVLPGDPDRDRLWEIVTKYNKAYNEYQKKTKRPIPVVRLTPKA